VRLDAGELILRQKKNIAPGIGFLQPIDLSLDRRISAIPLIKAPHDARKPAEDRRLWVRLYGDELLVQIFFVRRAGCIQFRRKAGLYRPSLTQYAGEAARLHVGRVFDTWVRSDPYPHGLKSCFLTPRT